MNLKDDQHLKMLVESAPIGICILDAQTFTAELLNDKFLEIAGKPKDQILGKWYWEPFAEARAYFEDALAQVPVSGEAYFADEVKLMLIRHGKEEWIYVTFVYAPVKDDRGVTTKVAVWVLENTRQVLERERLALANTGIAAERDRLYNFFRQAPVGICVLYGPDMIYELANDAYKAMLPGREILGRPIFDALPELRNTPIHQMLKDVYHKGETFELKELLVPLSLVEGGPVFDRYFTLTYTPRYGLENVIDGIFIFAYDVTSILAGNLKLEETNALLQLAVDSSNLGVWSLDLKNNQLDLSSRVKEIYGFKDGPTLRQFIAAVEPEQREKLEAEIQNAIKNKGRFTIEYQINPWDGSAQKWVFISGIPQEDQAGKTVSLMGTVLDITERKADDLRKNDFIGMVSHELKTPLTSLTAIVQVANQKLKNSEDAFLAGAMEKASVQVKRMSNMINGFLNVSRLESAKLILDKQSFDLEELIEETIRETELTVTSHQFQFTPCRPVLIEADHDKIGSVITNLISNAVKYSPKGKEIAIKCEIVGDKAQVSVKDEGIGLKPQDLEKVFERYYRVASGPTQHISGFGIGLYLSADIIHRHGGEIWVESESDRGATFYFSLPLA